MARTIPRELRSANCFPGIALHFVRVHLYIVLEEDVYGLPLLRAKPEERAGVRRHIGKHRTSNIER
jgi:hypothetical protein